MRRGCLRGAMALVVGLALLACATGITELEVGLQVAELSAEELFSATPGKRHVMDATASGDAEMDLMESALETELSGSPEKDAAEARLAAEEMLYTGWRLVPNEISHYQHRLDVGEGVKDVDSLFDGPVAEAVDATGVLMEGCTFQEAVEANSTCAVSTGTCTYTPQTFSPLAPPKCEGQDADGNECALHDGTEQACNGGPQCKLNSNGTACALARTQCPNVMDPAQAHVCSNSTGAEICEDRTCTTWAGMYTTHCNKDEGWRNNSYCARSCYEHGVGYLGDQCSVFTATPSAAPTSSPTRRPTTMEEALPPISQCFDDPKWKDDCLHVKEHCLRSLVMKARCRRTCGCGPKVEVYIPTEDEKPFLPPTPTPTPAPTAYMDPPECGYTGGVEVNTQCVVNSGNCSFAEAVESAATCTGYDAENNVCTLAVATNATEASCSGDAEGCAEFTTEDACTTDDGETMECSWNPGSPAVEVGSQCAVSTGNCTYTPAISTPATCGNGTDAEGKTCAVHPGAEPTCSGGTHCAINTAGTECLDINHECSDQAPPGFDKSCTSWDSDLTEKYCSLKSSWMKNKYCQQTCWDRGAGYPGDWCHPLYGSKNESSNSTNTSVVEGNNTAVTNSITTTDLLDVTEMAGSEEELGAARETEAAEEAAVAAVEQLAQTVSKQANAEAARAASEDVTIVDMPAAMRR